MTKNQKLAFAAAAIIFAAQDDNLRDLSADDRAIALQGREKAWRLLRATGVQPTELKALGLKFIADALGRPWTI